MRIESEDDLQRDAEFRRELDLSSIGRTIARRKLWVIGPVAFCFIASIIGVNLVKPRYTAESKILIENGENFFTRPDRGERETAQLPDDEAVQSQVQLISSRDIARDAITALDLKGNPEFDPLANGLGVLSRAAVFLGLERDPMRVSSEERILTSYYDKLTVYPVIKSRVLSVQFTSQNPDLAAKAANTISDLYINLQSSTKRDAARTAAASLASLIADLRVRAAAAETKAQTYRAGNGLLIGSNNTTITAQQLTDINTQLAQARSAEADAQAKAKLLRDMIRANRVGDVPDVANNDLIRRISDQRITLKAQIAQQGRTLLPGHPRMQEMSAQLADLDQQLRLEGERTVRTLENEARIAASRVVNLQTALDTQKKTASVAGSDEVALRDLESQARLLKDQLEFNTQKYQEALARESAASTPADARIISRAVAPEVPSFPKKGPMIAIFTLAGLLLSIGLIIARELLSGRAFLRDTSPGSMPVPVSGNPEFSDDAFVDPRSRRPRGLSAQAVEPGAPFARTPTGDRRGNGQFEAVVEDIHQRRKLHGAVRVAIAGADPEIAVLPVALSFARALARQDRVILVDCGAVPGGLDRALMRSADDLAARGPVLGLKDLLVGATTFAEVIHRDPLSRLHIVPLGRGQLEGNAEGFDMVVDALAETYDHVVLAVPVPRVSTEMLRRADPTDLAVLLFSADAPRSDVDASRAALYAAGVAEVIGFDAAPGLDGQAARSAA
ncbi:lipopolysaccharide biosynthesis protein [Lichenihabitans sp. PAMC28606]|uniref:GumC family protein n=1 Tax=Lichenihabitans sp. PAMC28606 TaxID=2880932 RepID=UPI001D0B6047|nr:Wzz/FepE/Etk N-terminal domain-containing protein [Lichenihabitans sp. PAMC28606]UDL95419.1 lipopolysaccharide biosynthesis protein [Lichenihabitans sp. PAMC28606]